MAKIDPNLLLNCKAATAPAAPRLQPSALISSTGDACQVRTYETIVPRSSIYVGMQYAEAQETNGFLSFEIDPLSPERHPYDVQVITYSRGFLQITNEDLAAELDKVASKPNTPFRIAENYTYQSAPRMIADRGYEPDIQNNF